MTRCMENRSLLRDHKSLQLDISSNHLSLSLHRLFSHDSPLFSYIRVIISIMSFAQDAVQAAHSTRKELSSVLSYPFLRGEHNFIVQKRSKSQPCRCLATLTAYSDLFVSPWQ